MSMPIYLNLADPEHKKFLEDMFIGSMHKALATYDKNQQKEKTYSVSKAMKVLGCGRDKVNSLINKGILKVNSANQVLGSSIDEYFKAQDV